MRINLYKIDLKSFDEVKKELSNGNHVYELVGSKNVNNSTFYLFINQRKREEKKWFNELLKVFEDLKNINPNFGEIYNAILIFESENNLFGIPFGYAYHKLRGICDPEFAMNFAEAELPSSNIELKGSIFIQNTKLKELVRYKPGSVIKHDPGESFYFVIGKPKNPYFGNKIKCGFSIEFSKEFSLENEESLNEINKFINKVNSSSSSRNKKISNFPRIYRLKKSDPFTKKLDDFLLKKLKEKEKGKDFEDIEVFIEHLFIFHEYGFLDFESEVTIKYNDENDKVKLYSKKLDYTLDSICDFLKEKDVKDLKDVRIVFQNQEMEENEFKLKDILFVHLKYEKENYVLNEGFWGKYNDSFEKIIKEKLNDISNKKVKINEFKIKGLKNEDKIISKIVSSSLGIESLHKCFVSFQNGTIKAKKIEIADLYKDNDRELITVKRGKNRDLCYAFDQAYLGTICLSQRESIKPSKSSKTKLNKNKLEKILALKLYSILLIFEQESYSKQIKNNEFNLNNLQSFILKLKIAWWDDFIKTTNLDYRIYVEGIG